MRRSISVSCLCVKNRAGHGLTSIAWRLEIAVYSIEHLNQTQLHQIKTQYGYERYEKYIWQSVLTQYLRVHRYIERVIDACNHSSCLCWLWGPLLKQLHCKGRGGLKAMIFFVNLTAVRQCLFNTNGKWQLTVQTLDPASYQHTPTVGLCDWFQSCQELKLFLLCYSILLLSLCIIRADIEDGFVIFH